MQLLTLAGTLFFVALTAATSEPIGPCTKARNDAGPSMPGKYIPQCTEYGYFKPTQCHGSIGRCWCVVPDTGKPTDSTASGEPDCTICHMKRAEALRLFKDDSFVPQCDEDGLFNATQGLGANNWCVYRFTGEEIQGSRTGPGTVFGNATINCTVLHMWAAMGLYHDLENKGPCYAKILDAYGRESTPGFHTPPCTANGYYKTEQSHDSTGYTWCVNPETGAEVKGTRRSTVEPRATCGACFKEIEDKLTRKPVPGMELPKCNPENGDYLREQQHEGYRWCANPTNGAVEGKKYPPGDQTALPCLNN